MAFLPIDRVRAVAFGCSLAVAACAQPLMDPDKFTSESGTANADAAGNKVDGAVTPGTDTGPDTEDVKPDAVAEVATDVLDAEPSDIAQRTDATVAAEVDASALDAPESISDVPPDVLDMPDVTLELAPDAADVSLPPDAADVLVPPDAPDVLEVDSVPDTPDAPQEVAPQCTLAADCAVGKPPLAACLVHACNSAKCGTAFAPPGSACDDKNACTALDQCDSAGSCLAGKPTACTGTDCTTATCDPKTGECIASNKPDTTACSDGVECTKPDTCAGGKCKPGPVVCACQTDGECDDKNACTADSCSKVNGVCVVSPLPCQKPACAKDADCAKGVCDPGALACVACTEDGQCGGSTPVCKQGLCVAGKVCKSASDCKALGQVCDTSGGHCVDCAKNGDCEASQVCLNEECVPKTACTGDKSCVSVCAVDLGYCVTCNVNDDCDVKHFCGADHACHADVCQSLACLGAQLLACKPDGSGYTQKSCDDANVCTQDGCDAVKGCLNPATTATATACEDGNACTVGDSCAKDVCTAGAVKKCDDGNPCTIDTCEAKTGCKFANAEADVVCGVNASKCDGNGVCIYNCVRVVTSTVTVAAEVVTGIAATPISYAMIGAGGGGGTSYPGIGGTTGSNAAAVTGTFFIGTTQSIAVYVGGGGGGGYFGGGGGSGYFGGGGGGNNSGGGGGSSAIVGPNGGPFVASGANGAGSGSGAGGGGTDSGGKGGSNGTTGSGGSNGGDGASGAQGKGGTGANTWATSTTLPAAAGMGGALDSGGNAGLVILTYKAKTCPL